MEPFTFPPSPKPATEFEMLSPEATSETYSTSSEVKVKPEQLRKVKPRRRSARPTIPDMIDEAIFEECPQRKGISFVAIKKYLEEKYNVNIKHSAKRIRDYIKESLENGRFIQKTGRGLGGSFRLAANIRSILKRQSENIPLKVKSRRTNMTSQTTRKRKADSESLSPASPSKKHKRKTVPEKSAN